MLIKENSFELEISNLNEDKLIITILFEIYH